MQESADSVHGPPPYRLGRDFAAPVQQSSVTCGSACLTVARMLVNPMFAQWVVRGIPFGGGEPDGRAEHERFGDYERVVLGRTNGLLSGGRLQLPWPRSLGTPPWGARRELQDGGSRDGASYQTSVVRMGSRVRRRAAYAALASAVGEGQPALLYVGSPWLPRHVTLVLPGQTPGSVDVYDPATGTVGALPAEAFVARRLRIAGWDVPWFVISADG